MSSNPGGPKDPQRGPGRKSRACSRRTARVGDTAIGMLIGCYCSGGIPVLSQCFFLAGEGASFSGGLGWRFILLGWGLCLLHSPVRGGLLTTRQSLLRETYLLASCCRRWVLGAGWDLTLVFPGARHVLLSGFSPCRLLVECARGRCPAHCLLDPSRLRHGDAVLLSSGWRFRGRLWTGTTNPVWEMLPESTPAAAMARGTVSFALRVPVRGDPCPGCYYRHSTLRGLDTFRSDRMRRRWLRSVHSFTLDCCSWRKRVRATCVFCGLLFGPLWARNVPLGNPQATAGFLELGDRSLCIAIASCFTSILLLVIVWLSR